MLILLDVLTRRCHFRQATYRDSQYGL